MIDLDTPGGHILVALFIFIVGVGLLWIKPDVSTQIISGALGSLYTAMRIGGSNKS